MTHHLAKRNLNAKVVRPFADRLTTTIQMTSAGWPHQHEIAEATDDARLGFATSFLVNRPGLNMLALRDSVWERYLGCTHN